MLRRGISIKSSTSTIRRFLDIMTSKAHDLQGSCKLQCNGIGLCQSGQCIKSLFIRTVSSCSTNSGPGKVTDESVDRKSKEAVLQWDKLSEDEKNIYFAHKSACMVSPSVVALHSFILFTPRSSTALSTLHLLYIIIASIVKVIPLR